MALFVPQTTDGAVIVGGTGERLITKFVTLLLVQPAPSVAVKVTTATPAFDQVTGKFTPVPLGGVEAFPVTLQLYVIPVIGFTTDNV
jgi:hypothetical protein